MCIENANQLEYLPAYRYGIWYMEHGIYILYVVGFYV